MRKKGKILSIVLSVMMLMQIFAITSFAAQAPTNVHWAKDGDPNKFSDAELVFNLVDGIEVYKITLYKDNQEIYTLTGGYSSDTGIFYEWFENVLNTFGPGSYTATVGTVSKEVYEQAEDDNVPALATSEMSDVLVWTGSVKKEETKTETQKTETASSSSTTPTQNTANTNTLPVNDANIRNFPQIVRITDIHNNDLFEITEEHTDEKKIGRVWESRKTFKNNVQTIAALPNKELTWTYNIGDKSFETTYYDGLNVFDIRDMKFSDSGYTDEHYKLKIFEKDKTNGCIKLYDTIIKYYEYGYIHTENWAYDTVNNIMYIYDFINNGNYMIDYIRNDGDLFIFENSGKDKNNYHLTKMYKAKIMKAPIVAVCYTVPMGGIPDPDAEHDYRGKIAFDQVPVIENGRTLVPLRAIFEKIGATVEWDGNTQTVKATKGDTSISLTINNTTAYKNGQPITLDVPAKILNGRTLVPVRFVADCFGVDVQWVQETQTVLLTAK